jgi:hypothetical protein
VHYWNINNFFHQTSIWKGNLNLLCQSSCVTQRLYSKKGLHLFICKHGQDFTSVSYSSCISWKCLYTYVCKNRVFRNFTELVISPELIITWPYRTRKSKAILFLDLLIILDVSAKPRDKKNASHGFSVTDCCEKNFS